jgi:hypothetical protein
MNSVFQIQVISFADNSVQHFECYSTIEKGIQGLYDYCENHDSQDETCDLKGLLDSFQGRTLLLSKNKPAIYFFNRRRFMYGVFLQELQVF